MTEAFQEKLWMSTLYFDRHEFIKKLRAAGLPEDQAEIQAEALSLAFGQFRESERMNDLATKRDLKELELSFRKEMAEAKADLIRWVIGVGVLQTALIAGLLLKLIPG